MAWLNPLMFGPVSQDQLLKDKEHLETRRTEITTEYEQQTAAYREE